MKLGVNGWRLRTHAGVARVILNIIRYWDADFVAGRFDEITLYSPIPLPKELPIPDFIRQKVVGPDMRMLLWENIPLPLAARDDVLLCPSYSRPIFTSAKTVSLMYEATQKLYPQHYPRQTRYIQTPLYGWSARNSTRVITNTIQAREDILSGYQAPADRLKIVPLAPAEVFHTGYEKSQLDDMRLRYAGADVPYFLYVGSLTARRNVPRLVEALAQVKQATSIPHRLVIVGRNTTNIDLQGLTQGLGIDADVKHYAFVPDEDLAPLYSAAEAFVLPYSYESAAALTLLEAQAAGAPVVTADTPGLRQAAGAGALFIPDVEVPSIAAAMQRIASDPALRRQLTEDGSANAALYSWRRTSGEVLDILLEAATSSDRTRRTNR